MDYLLKNGTIFDSDQKCFLKRDVLIRGQRIVAVENNIIEDSSFQIIDCEKLIISPGFIDCHSHNDFFNFKDFRYFESFINQGITTQIAGNCGFSYYGSDNTNHGKLIGGNLFQTDHTLSFKKYREYIENNLSLNMAFLVGHGTLRTCIKGFENSDLNEIEAKELRDLTEQNLSSGCMGGSLGLMYEPGIYASKKELLLFAEEIKKQDKVLTVHPRANSDISLAYPIFRRKHIKLALKECISIMEKTKVNLEYSHLIFVGSRSWKSLNRILKIFKKYHELGYNLNFDIYPFDFGASVITVLCPPWYLCLSEEKRNRAFTQFKLKAMIKITRKLLGIEYRDLKVSYINKEPFYQKFEGQNLEQIAESMNLSPLDAYIHLINVSEGKAKILLSKYTNDKILKTLMNSDFSLFMTDAWFEESGFQNEAIYSAYPLFIKKTLDYQLSLEKTLFKMTKKICDKFQISNRGQIKEKYFADITIFDLEALKQKSESKKLADSIKYVFINGELVKDNTTIKDLKNGMIVEKSPF